jgi:hypothetical protein
MQVSHAQHTPHSRVLQFPAATHLHVLCELQHLQQASEVRQKGSSADTESHFSSGKAITHQHMHEEQKQRHAHARLQFTRNAALAQRSSLLHEALAALKPKQPQHQGARTHRHTLSAQS